MDIVGIGDSDVDLVIEVDHLPAPDEKVRGTLLGKYPGGVVANFCCAASRVGAKTGIVTTVGDDAFGDMARRSLEEFGVDTEGLVVHENSDTYFCVVHLDSSGEKALTIVETPNLVPSVEDLNIDYIQQARFAHLSSLGIDLARHLLSIESLNPKLSLDMESTAEGRGFEDWKSVLEHTYIVFLNEQGLIDLFDSEQRRTSARKLLEIGPEIVVITRGSRGVEVHREGGEFSLNAHEVPIQDTTGAGDCFNALFLSGLTRGWELRRCARRANAGAAMSIQEVGARSALPTPEQIDRFLGDRNESSD